MSAIPNIRLIFLSVKCYWHYIAKDTQMKTEHSSEESGYKRRQCWSPLHNNTTENAYSRRRTTTAADCCCCLGETSSFRPRLLADKTYKGRRGRATHSLRRNILLPLLAMELNFLNPYSTGVKWSSGKVALAEIQPGTRTVVNSAVIFPNHMEGRNTRRLKFMDQ